MKKKILILISVLALMLCSFFNGFKVSASPTHYDLNISNNALVFTFPDFHGSYRKEFIEIDGEEIILRSDNSLLNGDNVIAPVNAYEYIWAWYFEVKTIGIEDYIVNLSVYYLKANNYRTENFTFVDMFEIPVVSSNVLISMDYDSTLETYVDIEFDNTNIKQFLEYNGLQPGYSALGNMLESYYQSGYSNGFDTGINNQLAEPNWWVNMFNGIDAFLNINLLPGFTIGALFSIPLAFGVLKMILYFWRSGD